MYRLLMYEYLILSHALVILHTTDGKSFCLMDPRATTIHIVGPHLHLIRPIHIRRMFVREPETSVYFQRGKKSRCVTLSGGKYGKALGVGASELPHDLAPHCIPPPTYDD